MSDDDMELVRGSGNIFEDFNRADADIEQFRSVLAARIIGILDERGLSVRKAEDLTGFAAADFSRIRNARLDRFTIYRLMLILTRMGQKIDVDVKVTPRELIPQ